MVRSVFLLGLSRVWSLGAQFATFVIAARFLGPEDFGVYALVYLVCSFLLLAAGMGWGEYAFTNEDERPSAVAGALTAGLGGGVALAAAGYVADRMIAANGDLFLLSALLAGFMPLRAANAMLLSQLIVKDRLNRVASAQMLSETAFLIATAACLNMGLGLVSLGIAKIAQETTSLAICWQRSYPLVARWPDAARLRQMIGFVSKIQLSALAGFAQENISTLLIGLFLGPGGTGLYRAGARFPGAVSEVISEPLKPIAWISIRDAGNDPRRLRSSVLTLLTISLSAGAAAFTGLSLVAHTLVATLLGSEWSPAAMVIIMLAARRFLLLPVSVLLPLLAFSGHLNLAPRVAVASAILSGIALIIFAPFGLNWAAAGQVLATLGAVWIMMPAVQRAAGLRLTDIASTLLPAAAGCVAMVLVVLMSRQVFGLSLSSSEWPGPLRMAIEVCLGSITYAGTILTVSPVVRNVVRIEFAKWARKSEANNT